MFQDNSRGALSVASLWRKLRQAYWRFVWRNSSREIARLAQRQESAARNLAALEPRPIVNPSAKRGHPRRLDI